MSDESNCDNGREQEEHEPCVAANATPHEGKHAMNMYMKQLLAEKQRLEEKSGLELQLTHKLLANELERIGRGGGLRNSHEDRKFADIIKEKPIKVTIRVLVPVKEHPKFNFVGKLLGPKGNSLKRLQEDTMTKMAILGRGSMRDKHKEEELRASADPKFAHFNDDLHVEITAFAPPAEAHARVAYALAEVRKFLVPDYNDEIRQEQMREMQLLNTTVLGLTPPTGELVTNSSPSAQSPTTSPPPSTTVKTTSSNSNNNNNTNNNNNQNGRQVQTLQNGRSYLYNQQFLLHPAFRGLTARAHGIQLPVFHAGGGGSILNRLRPHPHLATPSINAANNRVSPGAVKQQRNNILSILAGGPRSVLSEATGDADSSSTVYSLYENYAAAAVAAAATTTGYGLIEGYANGNGVLTAEPLDEIVVPQETVNGSGTGDLTGARSDAGAVKIDRARYRHDPYSRYKLTL